MMQKPQAKQCSCPFCVQELTRKCNEPPFCSPCSISVVTCAECGTSYSPATHEQCPKCGSRQEKKQP